MGPEAGLERPGGAPDLVQGARDGVAFRGLGNGAGPLAPEAADELDAILTEPDFQATDRTREINIQEIREKHSKD